MAWADSSAGMMPSVRERRRAGIERRLIGDGGIFGAVLVGEPGVLGADGGIIEASGDGMRCGDLAVLVSAERRCRCPGERRGARR